MITPEPTVAHGAEPDVRDTPWRRLGPVLIVGGGIGGLAAALALAKRGIPSHVLERRAALAEEGAGIQLGPNGTRILSELGVVHDLEPHVGQPGAIRVHDGRDGRLLARLPLGSWIEARHGSPYWVAHRHDLHAALLGCVRNEPLISLTLDAEFAAREAADRGVALRTRDGRVWNGCALIGADGLRSEVRRCMFTPARPVFSGKCAVRGTIPMAPSDEDPRQADTFVWLRPEGHVVHYPVRDGAELAVVGIFDSQNAAPGWGMEADKDWVAAQAAAFPAPVRELLAALPSPRMWGLHQMDRSFDWCAGEVALLGDAAHPVLPFLAQGAVLALEDAVVLSEALASHAAVADGLAAYAARRRARAQRVADQSRRNGRIYHLSSALAGARNLVLRSAPGERLMAGYDWLYGWRA